MDPFNSVGVETFSFIEQHTVIVQQLTKPVMEVLPVYSENFNIMPRKDANIVYNLEREARPPKNFMDRNNLNQSAKLFEIFNIWRKTPIFNSNIDIFKIMPGNYYELVYTPFLETVVFDQDNYISDPRNPILRRYLVNRKAIREFLYADRGHLRLKYYETSLAKEWNNVPKDVFRYVALLEDDGS